MTVVPEGYELLGAEDAEGRIQRGDLLWCEGNWEWQVAEKSEIGDYVSGFYGVARKKLALRPLPVLGWSRAINALTNHVRYEWTR